MVTHTAPTSSAVTKRHAVAQRSECVVAIHQPNYVPWLGYFYKISRANVFVFLDSVAYSSGSFTNRNCIKTPTGVAWLSIPVLKAGRSGQPICEVETNNVQPWVHKHITSIRSNYGKAPFFKEVFSLLEPYYRATSEAGRSLAKFNIALIGAIAEYLGLCCQFVRSSELPTSGHKTALLLGICQTIGATTYFAGSGGKGYQEDAMFEKANIATMYSTFAGRTYPQRFGEFAAHLSILDTLMNCGCQGTRALLDIDSFQQRNEPIAPTEGQGSILPCQ